MARVKLSALLTSIAGRYGGGVFRNWKGLTVLGVLPDSVANPNTPKQVAARELLGFCSKAWAGLTRGAKNQWHAVAEYLTIQWGNFENEVGSHVVIRTPRGPFTGLGALVSVHALLGSAGAWDTADALEDAPVSVTAPTQPTVLSVTGTTAGMVVTWVDPASWGTNGTAGYVRIWFKSEEGTFFAQISGSVAAAVQTYTIDEGVPAGGTHPIDLAIGSYFIQCDAINAEGLRGAPSAVFDLSIIDPV